MTAHLNDLGLSASGVNLSPQMVAVARRSHPGLQFDVGSMLALDLPDGSLGGVMAWYSIIHIPQERLPEVFAGFCRVLAPGGFVLLAFQAGDGLLHLTQAPLTLSRRSAGRAWGVELDPLWARSSGRAARGYDGLGQRRKIAGGADRAGYRWVSWPRPGPRRRSVMSCWPPS